VNDPKRSQAELKFRSAAVSCHIEAVRTAALALLGGAAVWPFAARAQPPGKLPHLGVMVSASPPHPLADHFRRGLRSFGYTEGRSSLAE
jgi:putative tryptophan/tyrosine transport system substrate-binding protein